MVKMIAYPSRQLYSQESYSQNNHRQVDLTLKMVAPSSRLCSQDNHAFKSTITFSLFFLQVSHVLEMVVNKLTIMLCWMHL